MDTAICSKSLVAQAFTKLHATICRLFPPGAKHQRWLAWAIQLEDPPGTACIRLAIDLALIIGQRRGDLLTVNRSQFTHKGIRFGVSKTQDSGVAATDIE